MNREMTMKDFDVIVIGGGVNGLACASYLGKAGLKTLVLEAKGECGAHCDTSEPGIPGFLHNLHATWLITALSPAMDDLELEKYGLELRATDYAYGKTFVDNKCALFGVDLPDTFSNWEGLSKKDTDTLKIATEVFFTRLEEVLDVLHKFLFTAPDWNIMRSFSSFIEEVFGRVGIKLTFEDIQQMNGFQLLDLLFESEHVKTMIQSLSWIGAYPPIHREVGAVGAVALSPLTGPIIPVHQAKGGSHALTHALVKCATANGVKILTSCPVKKIIVEKGVAKGVVLSEKAIFPNETISAKKIVSNLTVVPTFIDLIGEEHIGTQRATSINRFLYDEQVLFGVYYALKDAPQWKSADFNEGIQSCFMGYFGGENTDEMEKYAVSLINGKIHNEVIANWFIPTLADPTQAPEGCHTSFVWFDVPPLPTKWNERKLDGFKDWDKIKFDLADSVTDTYERFAPGFKKLILDRIIYTPVDIYRNNPSAIRGNWCGGSMVPEQFFVNRPLPGILKKGGSRSFIDNLYLSNSINPMGATWLASGYLAASEVAEDMGVREQSWWQGKACQWYLRNITNIPRSLGVRRKK